MNVRIFGITDRSTLAALPHTELSPSWQEDADHRWIDVEAASEDELRQLLAPLGLHAAVVNACLKRERAARFISHQAALYLEVPTHDGWDQDEKPYLSILCLKTTIITIHRDPLHTIEDIVRNLDAELPLYAQSSSALLYYLLVQIGRSKLDAALDVRAEAERLDQACHDGSASLDPQEVAILRRKVSHYGAVHDDHAYIAGVLQTVESDALRVSEQSKFFHDMLRLSELSGQLIDGAEARVNSLQRDLELTMQKRVDDRLRFLTILSAVLMPATMIPALYGMNFNNLPAMGHPWGYLVVIALMLTTAGATGGYLYKRGWFD